MAGDRLVERRVVDPARQVDHLCAGLERGDRDVGEVGLDRHQQAVGDERVEHRQQRGELAVDVDEVGVGAGRLGADVDHHGALDRHPPGAVQRGGDVVGDALAVRRVARQVDHAELVGPVVEGPARQLEGADGMVDRVSGGLPRGGAGRRG